MGIFDMFAWVVRILAWLPGAIKWAEDHYGTGTGAEKRENVAQWLLSKIPEGVWSGAKDFGLGLGLVIDGIVLMFNATGVFKKA